MSVPESFTARGIDPIFRLVLIRKEQCDPAKAQPVFGEHCDTMFGNGCPFAGTSCPSADFVPAAVSRNPIALSLAVASRVLVLPPAEAPGAAFLALHRGLPMERTPETMALARIGVNQLRAGATTVNKIVTEWCKETGQTIHIGDDEYGWRVVETLDVETALRFMTTAGMTCGEIANVVSMAASSLNRISKRKYPGLAAAIRMHCIEEAGGQEFGRIRTDD